MSGFSVARQEIENTLEWFIRTRCVAMGYLADVTLYQPSNPANKAAYKAANQAIVTSGREIIMPFGVSSPERREEVKCNKIFINLRQINPGTVSLWGDTIDPSTSLPGTWERRFRATSTSTVIYDIRSVTESAEYDRLCTQAIMQGITASRVGQGFPIVLPNGTIDNTRYIQVRLVNATDIKTPKFLERLYTFEVLDVYLDDWGYTPTDTGIVPIIEVETPVVINDEDPIILLNITPP